MTTTTIYDTENRYSWHSKTEHREGDVVISNFTVFDNGLETLLNYDAGVLRHSSQRDPADVDGTSLKNWSMIDVYFDENGVLEARVTQYDNGISGVKLYDDGILRESVSVDESADGSAFTWESITRYYDAAGQMEASVKVFDNGIETVEQFANGFKTHTLSLDRGDGSAENLGVKNWSSIETFYDATGQIAARLTAYDDGTTRDDVFLGGTLFQTVQRDNPDSDGDGVKAWDTINKYYDLDGTLQAVHTSFDNGRDVEVLYSASGIKTQQYDKDGYGEGVFNWDDRTQFYNDDGELIFKVTNYDNGDITELSYEDGLLYFKREFDGDGSASWLARDTYYDADGSISAREVYLTGADLPVESGFGDIDIA